MHLRKTKKYNYVKKSGGGEIDRTEYIEHCKTLIEDNQNKQSYDYLLTKISEIVNIEIVNHNVDSKSYTNFIFNTDFDAESTLDCLSLINIISFKCAYVFTYIQNINTNIFTSPLNDIYSISDVFDNIKNNYQNLPAINTYVKEMLSKYTNHYKSDGNNISDAKPMIITILDYLKLDENLDTYLDGYYLCCLVFKNVNADGYLVPPLEYVLHDIFHANQYIKECHIKIDEREKRKKLFEFIKSFKNKYNKWACKVILFFKIHETHEPGLEECKVFDKITPEATNKILDRVNNESDLQNLIPKKTRDEHKIYEYIQYAIAMYNGAISIINNKSGGRNTHRKYSKKYRKSRRR